MSNVPDLDDEERILGKTMKRFRQELNFGRLAASIHHYNSMSLLTEEIFSIKRPNSKLTREYKQLTSAITRENLADRDAVVDQLKSTIYGSESNEKEFAPAGMIEKLPKILSNFANDPE
jgi:hypothetical protein